MKNKLSEMIKPVSGIILSRAIFALLGALSGMAFAAFPLEMAVFCGG